MFIFRQVFFCFFPPRKVTMFLSPHSRSVGGVSPRPVPQIVPWISAGAATWPPLRTRGEFNVRFEWKWSKCKCGVCLWRVRWHHSTAGGANGIIARRQMNTRDKCQLFISVVNGGGSQNIGRVPPVVHWTHFSFQILWVSLSQWF